MNLPGLPTGLALVGGANRISPPSSTMCNVSACVSDSASGILLNYLHSKALRDKKKIHRRCCCTSVLRLDVCEPCKGQTTRKWEDTNSYPHYLLHIKVDHQKQLTFRQLVRFRRPALPGSGMFVSCARRPAEWSCWQILYESTRAVRFSSFHCVASACYDNP